MTAFRKLVEDQVQQIMSTQPIKQDILTDDIKAKVLDAVNKMEIDVRELPSYKNYGHPPQNFARFPEPDSEEWDDGEEFQAQIDQFLEYMNTDGILEYIDLPREKWNDAGYLKELEAAIRTWLTSLQD